MAAGQTRELVQRLRGAVLRHDPGALTDGQLLEGYLARRDQAAFAALVRRHGPMVLGVCRRLLRQEQDAEDAFQATFLVLSRKAAAVVPREQLGNWLYGVAYRTALRARAAIHWRRAKERRVADMPRHEALGEEVWHDLQPLLDAEIERLPDKYRVPIVLCDLEGKTRKEAARQLGWPEGTLSGRLSRARALLAQRLRRRGVTLATGSLALVLSQHAAPACVPAPLVAGTVQAAARFGAGPAGGVAAPGAALAEGVLKAMLLTRLKIVTAVVLALGLIAAGLGVSWQRARAARRADEPPPGQTGTPARRADPAPAGEGKQPGFVRAEITVIARDGGRDEHKTLTDLAQVARLASFFPGLGDGKKSEVAGGWSPRVAVQFEGGGKKVRVVAHPDLGTWRADPRVGDRPARAGLGEYLDELFLGERQERAVAAVRRLGGTVEVDEKSPGKPVIGISLLNTRVSDQDLELLRGLTRLRSLNLDNTPVTNAGLEHLQGLTGLHTLDLFNTRVSDAGLAHLRRLKGLRCLYLTFTGVTDAGLEHLRGLKGLQKLYLGGTAITDAGLAHLRDMTDLQFLGLDKTAVTDVGLERLRGLTRLRWLNVDNTKVTDKGLGHLQGLAELRVLSAANTRVTDEGLDAFRWPQSGLQPGERVSDMVYPVHATGPGAGKRWSMVCKYGRNPVVLIFARELSPPLVRLIKRIDAATARGVGHRLGSAVIIYGAAEGLEDRLKALAQAERIGHTVLAFHPAEQADDSDRSETHRIRRYKLAKEADVTVILYKQFQVEANFVFRKGELKDKDIDQILDSLAKMVPVK
jgi:RNA polymerase sigma factor (sigma-70 family)